MEVNDARGSHVFGSGRNGWPMQHHDTVTAEGDDAAQEGSSGRRCSKLVSQFITSLYRVDGPGCLIPTICLGGNIYYRRVLETNKGL